MRVVKLVGGQKIDRRGVDEHIGSGDEAAKQRLAISMGEVEGDTLFVDVVMPKVQTAFRVRLIADKGADVTRRIAARGLNFNDFCAISSQDFTAERRLFVGYFQHS